MRRRVACNSLSGELMGRILPAASVTHPCRTSLSRALLLWRWIAVRNFIVPRLPLVQVCTLTTTATPAGWPLNDLVTDCTIESNFGKDFITADGLPTASVTPPSRTDSSCALLLWRLLCRKHTSGWQQRWQGGGHVNGFITGDSPRTGRSYKFMGTSKRRRVMPWRSSLWRGVRFGVSCAVYSFTVRNVG